MCICRPAEAFWWRRDNARLQAKRLSPTCARRRTTLSFASIDCLTTFPRAVAARPATGYTGYMVFAPFDPKRPEAKRRRFRPVPVRMLVPNLITLLALCAGLTAMRIAVEGRLDLALAAIVFAAALDGIGGPVARMLKGPAR